MGRFLLLFILVPLAEALLLAKIGALMGWMNTIALVVLTGVVGAWLFRLEGGRAWGKWQEALAHGRLPEEGVLGGVLLLVGGVLLITPGVITDLVGLLLLLPPTRALAVAWLRPWLQARIAAQADERREASRVRVIHFDMGAVPHPHPSPPVGRRLDESAQDDEAAVVVGRRVPLRRAAARQAPPVIDADFEVVEHEDD